MNQIRHRRHLLDCCKQLTLFTQSNGEDVVMLAEYLRRSVTHLEKLVGKITNDKVLDIIFKEFCIGK